MVMASTSGATRHVPVTSGEFSLRATGCVPTTSDADAAQLTAVSRTTTSLRHRRQLLLTGNINVPPVC